MYYLRSIGSFDSWESISCVSMLIYIWCGVLRSIGALPMVGFLRFSDILCKFGKKILVGLT